MLSMVNHQRARRERALSFSRVMYSGGSCALGSRRFAFCSLAPTWKALTSGIMVRPSAKLVKKMMAKVVLMSTKRFGVRKLSTSSSVMMPRMPQYHMITWHRNGIFSRRPRFRKNDSTNVLHARDTKHMSSVIRMNQKFQFSFAMPSGRNSKIPNDTNTSSSDIKSSPLSTPITITNTKQ